MSTSKEKNIYSQRKIEKKDIVSFIKKSSLLNNIFLKNINLNAKIGERGSALTIDSKKELKEGDIIDFYVGEEMLSIPLGERKEFLLAGSFTIKENPRYIYPYLDILNFSDFNFKITGVSKEFIEFEALPDSFDFIMNNINNVYKVKFNEQELEIEIHIKESLEDKLTVKAKVLNKNKGFNNYIMFVEDVREQNKEKVKSELFFMLDKNLAVF